MKSEHKKMKNKAWKMFALYILLRDCNAQGICECCTCGEKHPFWDAKMQAGHFVSGRTNSVLFNEKIVHSQCLTEESTVIDVRNMRVVSLKDIEEGDTIFAFDEETYKQRFAKVESNKSFVPEELYEVELENGKKFWATPDHRVVANGEWHRIDDMLHNCTDYDILHIL